MSGKNPSFVIRLGEWVLSDGGHDLFIHNGSKNPVVRIAYRSPAFARR